MEFDGQECRVFLILKEDLLHPTCTKMEMSMFIHSDDFPQLKKGIYFPL